MTFKNKLIGHVSVDSGSLLITDPCYLSHFQLEGNEDYSSYWKDKETRKIWAFKFHCSDNHLPEVNFFPGSFADPIPELDNKCPNDLIREGRWRKYTRPNPDGMFEYSQSGCSAAHLRTEERAGRLRHTLGHEGAGLCFSSGYGDGYYPVYATYNEDGVISEITIRMDLNEE